MVVLWENQVTTSLTDRVVTTPVLTFFNNKGGVGKTSLIYHLSWMFASLGKRVVVADFDPQANLTAAFLDETRIEAIWDASTKDATIYQCVKPLMETGDIVSPRLQHIAENLHMVPGDVALSNFEETLSVEWPRSKSNHGLYRPMRILTAFWQIMQMAAAEVEADIVLVDVGPNLDAINRSILLATDYVAIPLGADLFSLQGLSNLGSTLRYWRSLWKKRLDNWDACSEKADYPSFQLPPGKMQPIGYLCQQYGVRLDRPITAYDKWARRIPTTYREAVLNDPPDLSINQVHDDPLCLAIVKHYRSLISMAQEKRKPIFNLTSADGAIGSHAGAVSDARKDFRRLAGKIAGQIGLLL